METTLSPNKMACAPVGRLLTMSLPALWLFSKWFALNEVWWAFLLRRIYRQKVAPLPEAAVESAVTPQPLFIR